MPSSFPYVVRAAFDNLVEGFEDALTYGNVATKIDLGSAQDQVYTRDKVWIPQRVEIARHWHEHHKPAGAL